MIDRVGVLIEVDDGGGMRGPIGIVWMNGVLLAVALGLLVCHSPVFAQSVLAQASANADAPASAPAVDLSNSKQQLFRDYERFEKSLFDVAEQVRRKDPERAELLYRARTQSQEQNILSEMKSISELLKTQGDGGVTVAPQFGPAADRQGDVVARLEGVLKILQSLDDRERVAAEIQRVQELLKDTNRIIARQKDVRADTQRKKQPEQTKKSQQKVSDEAQKLADRIDQEDAERDERRQAFEEDRKKAESSQESQKPNGSEGKSGQSPDATPNSSKEGGSQESKDSQPKDPQFGANGQQSENSQSKGGESSEGGQQGGQQGQQSGAQGDQQDSKQQGQQQSSGEQQKSKTAGREELEQAQKEMQKAIEELEKQRNEDALQSQDEAVRKLEELKAKLEEILRQLREDERESYLTLLEARFQNMLRRQQNINKETLRVHAIPNVDRVRQNFASQTEILRKDQDDNSVEAAKAGHLLKEDGSSVAFPEAVNQMHENMLVVAARLARQDTGETTQLVEQLIVETLEEMISALRKEMEKSKDEKQQQQQGQQGGQPGGENERTLVDQLAELRLIRSLQTQINRLTKQVGQELNESLPTNDDQSKLIQDIRQRQERIQKSTYDLSIGRNR